MIRTLNLVQRIVKAKETCRNTFFVVRHGDRTRDHSDAIEFSDIGAVQLEAIRSTGEILRELNYPMEAGSEWRMEVADEARKPLFSLRVIAELHK